MILYFKGAIEFMISAQVELKRLRCASASRLSRVDSDYRELHTSRLAAENVSLQYDINILYKNLHGTKRVKTLFKPCKCI